MEGCLSPLTTYLQTRALAAFDSQWPKQCCTGSWARGQPTPPCHHCAGCSPAGLLQSCCPAGWHSPAAVKCHNHSPTTGCCGSWQYVGVLRWERGQNSVRERSALCKSSHGTCGLAELQSPGSTQTAASTGWSLWPSSLLDHFFVSDFSGHQKRLRRTISSISGSPVHGAALTVKSSNAFISNLLSIRIYNRAISWFLLPRSQVHIVSGLQEIKT